ncbi:MAG: hypothetical protein LBD10_11460 [Desulfobulbus sp.]|jgi:hypothetical protein|uniref:hypothetical protein n=1 Tax=Desulfobulbus sp. TaxID=895 RepID=UPI00283CFF7E|nr:hypothetical protein [Desulfobulbus sp.]MDR2550805.1 hypothetical protein [Desulfobulbus sp.]
MLYIERDAQGAIAAIHRDEEGKTGLEPASLLEAEVLAFLRSNGGMETLDLQLMASDATMVRVLEDLIDVLVAKNLILITELPPQARDKILGRKQLRAQMADPQLMVDDIL